MSELGAGAFGHLSLGAAGTAVKVIVAWPAADLKDWA